MKKFTKLFTLFFALILGATTVSSCGGDKGTTAPDGTYYPEGFIRYAETTDVVRLNRDYKGRDFFTDGIAEVEVHQYIDGDTTHFQKKGDKTSEVIQSRYYGVNTPESTGSVEPYGKVASNFTKETLKSAKTLVISSDIDEYGVPHADSTGSRYLTMVWFSTKENAKFNELISLNLLLIEEGLSQVNGVDSLPRYMEVFYKAEAQAREAKIRIHSGKVDPNYNYGTYQTTDLFQIQDEIFKCVEDSTRVNKFNNVKVRIQGTVAGYANHILFLQAKREIPNTNPQEYEYAGINIFCGMGYIEEMYREKDAFIELCGLCLDSEEFGFQITSVAEFPAYDNGNPDATKVLKTPEESRAAGFAAKEFKATISEAIDYKKVLNSPINFGEEEFKVTEAFDPLNSKKQGGTLIVQSVSNPKLRLDFTIYISFAFKPYANREDLDSETYPPRTQWNNATDFKDKTFKFKGVYTVRKKKNGSYGFSLNPTSSDDIFYCIDK